MSFDIFFQTSRLSDQTEEAVNPFTGEVMQKPVGESLLSADRDALRELLSSHGATLPLDSNCYQFDFSDGSGFELFMDHLDSDADVSGGMAALRGLTTEILNVLYALAEAGNMVMLPAMEETRPLVTSREVADRVASRWPDVLVLASAEELGAFLQQGFAGWEAYRDRVTGED
jgi:hypothetical protein